MLDRITLIGSLEPAADLLSLHAQLISDAQSGDLVGSVVIGMYRRKTGSRNRQNRLLLAGWAARDLIYAVGAMDTCATLLHEIAREEPEID